MVVNKHDGMIICLSFAKGKTHDFRLFRQSSVHAKTSTVLQTDTDYQGVSKIHANSVLPKKRSKKHPLTKQNKWHNRMISSQRALNEHIIGRLKKFKVLAHKYRNRRKRFALRFNLIAGICNFEINIS